MGSATQNKVKIYQVKTNMYSYPHSKDSNNSNNNNHIAEWIQTIVYHHQLHQSACHIISILTIIIILNFWVLTMRMTMKNYHNRKILWRWGKVSGEIMWQQSLRKWGRLTHMAKCLLRVWITLVINWSLNECFRFYFAFLDFNFCMSYFNNIF